MMEDEAQYTKVDKEEDTRGVSRRDCFNRAAARREKREIKNLWHHNPRMSAMSLPTTSQHIGARVGITSRPITARGRRTGSAAETPE